MSKSRELNLVAGKIQLEDNLVNRSVETGKRHSNFCSSSNSKTTHLLHLDREVSNNIITTESFGEQ